MIKYFSVEHLPRTVIQIDIHDKLLQIITVLKRKKIIQTKFFSSYANLNNLVITINLNNLLITITFLLLCKPEQSFDSIKFTAFFFNTVAGNVSKKTKYNLHVVYCICYELKHQLPF